MSGGFPLGIELYNGTNIGVNTTTCVGTSITPNATANTMGSYTQLIAKTAADTVWAWIVLQQPASSSIVAFDIAVGAAGSEKVIIGTLQLANGTDRTNAFHFPVQIPAGTAVSARCQANAASGPACFISMILFDGSFTQIEGIAGVDAVGFLPATTLGTLVHYGSFTPPAKGNYAQIIAATVRDYMGFVVGLDEQNVGGAGQYMFDISLGGAGSEQIIIPNLNVSTTTGGDVLPSPGLGIFWVPIPAGTRIAARLVQSSGADCGMTLYGIYQ